MAVLRFLVHAVWCLVLLAVIPPAALSFVAALKVLGGRVLAGGTESWFVAGAVVFVPVGWWLRRWLDFWFALAHELSHAVTGTALGARPLKLHATAGGTGAVSFHGPRALYWVVLLAPYVVNPSQALVLLVPWLRPEALSWGACAAGAGLGFALVSNLIQVRLYQKDLREAGLVRSFLFILWGNLMVAGIMVQIVLGTGFARLPHHLATSFSVGLWRGVYACLAIPR